MKLGIIAPQHNKMGIEYVANLGLKWTEFDVNDDDISYLNIPEIKSALDEYGVNIGAVGRWGRPRINKDGSINTKEQNDERALIDFCREVGCPVYICGVNYVPEISLYSNYSSAIAYIQSLVDYAGGDVKVCIYNCSWHNYLYDETAWKLVGGHIPALGIKFDPSHSINGGRDYIRETLDYGHMFYHVHLKGTINIDGVHVDDPPAGLDSINWGMFLSLLAKQGYDGMLSIEPHSATWQGELGSRGVEYSVNYFKNTPFVTE